MNKGIILFALAVLAMTLISGCTETQTQGTGDYIADPNEIPQPPTPDDSTDGSASEAPPNVPF